MKIERLSKGLEVALNKSKFDRKFEAEEFIGLLEFWRS